jgi:hypothetical protein
MKKLSIALFVACLTLPACYDFDFPLDPKPVLPIDTRLVGDWRCLAIDADLEDPPGILQVARRGESIARWTFTSSGSEAAPNGGDPERSEYDVHGSAVGGDVLLNALELGEKANGKWNLVRYSFLLPDVVRLQVVNDEALPKVASAAALRALIEKRVEDPAIYKDLLVCVRAKKAPASASSPSPKS